MNFTVFVNKDPIFNPLVNKDPIFNPLDLLKLINKENLYNESLFINLGECYRYDIIKIISSYANTHLDLNIMRNMAKNISKRFKPVRFIV